MYHSNPVYLFIYCKCTPKLITENFQLCPFFFAVGGMNRSHRLSQGAKKVTPPSIPGFSNPRGSGSSFGSDLSQYSSEHRDESNVVMMHHPASMSTFSRAPNGESSSSTSPGKNLFILILAPRSSKRYSNLGP